MYAEQFKAFMARHNIASPGQWEKATNYKVSKSTITRGLKGEGKDVGVNTILELITPFNETMDQFLSMGEYSPEAQEKNKLVEQIECTIDEVDNSPAIPEDTAHDIIETLAVVQDHLIHEPNAPKTCPECAALNRIISYLEESIAEKNKVNSNMFKVIIFMLIVNVVLIVSDALLIMALINLLSN